MRWPIATGSRMQSAAFQIHDELVRTSLYKRARCVLSGCWWQASRSRGLIGVPFSYVGPSFERRQELVDLVDRDREADADAAVNGALDRVVDTDDLALCVDERSARIPRIDRGVGLDQVGAGRRGGLADVRHDPFRERSGQPERRTDGVDGVTNL